MLAILCAALIVVSSSAARGAHAGCVCADPGNFSVSPLNPDDLWSGNPTLCQNQYYSEGWFMYLQYNVAGLMSVNQRIHDASLHLEALSNRPRTVYLNVAVASAASAVTCNPFNVSKLDFAPVHTNGVVAVGAPVYTVGGLADSVQSYITTLINTAQGAYACPAFMIFRLNVYDPINNGTSTAVPLVIELPTGSNLELRVEYGCEMGGSGGGNGHGGSDSAAGQVSLGFMAVLFAGVAFLF